MLKNLMEDKRLDLDRRLLSVRRFASEPEPESKQLLAAAAAYLNPRRSALPFYKSDLNSGPIRNPGVVPFVWEQSPGRPKADGPRLDRPSATPRLPPGRILIEKEPASVAESEKKLLEDEDEKQQQNQQSMSAAAECLDDEEEEKFSDALETLSRTESFFMNCSVSGLSEVPEKKTEASGSFSTDPQVRDFMMGRFLPAAKAMAMGLPHTSSRKPPVQAQDPPVRVVQRVENGDQRRVRFPLNYQHWADLAQEGEGASCSFDDDDDDDDDDEEDYYDNGHFSSKVCGLIPKFCLLNPVPGMKIPGRRLPTSVRRIRGPQVKAMQHGSLGQADEEYSWEAVYKHKLMHGNPPPQAEDISKLTSESNHLAYWSDSPTADGSSPQRRSNNSGISPYRNEPSQSPFHEGKGFLGVPSRDRKGCKTDGSDSLEKDSENYWVVTPHHSNQCESGTMSPAVERTLHVDTVHMPETPMSKSSSLGTSSDNKGKTQSADEDSEVGAQSQRKDESLVLEIHDSDALQSKVTEIVATGPKVCTESLACGVMVENNGFKPDDTDDSPLSLKENNQVKNEAYPKPSLLSLPLPNSPSESWLSRTLPSVSSKNPSAQLFLGIHFQPRKQVSTSSSTIPKKEIPLKPSKVQRGQTRFSDMLAKPLSSQSEI